MQRLHELGAAVDDDVAVVRVAQLLDLRRHIAEITVELFHSGSESVVETTYLGMSLNLSANSPSRWGHASANPS